MRIRSVQIRDPKRAEKVVKSLRRLAWARCDLPVLRPSEWWRPRHQPKLPHHAALHVLVLHPRKGSGELEGWELARAAAEILEGRRGLVLDWACGFRKSGAVWLLVKPWAADAETGRRRWFATNAEDLAALREALAEPKEEAPGRRDGFRERGRTR